MKYSRIRIVDRRGRSRIGTKIVDGKKQYIFPGIIRPPAHSRRIQESLRSFRRFNRRDATKIIRQTIDLKTPFIRIGDVPLITYMSDKTGTMKAYKHETRIMPILYLHPSKPIGILVGGSLKVREWLEG